MSQDLFAAFGQTTVSPPSQPLKEDSKQTAAQPLHKVHEAQPVWDDVDDDDDFGDFEDASQSQTGSQTRPVDSSDHVTQPTNISAKRDNHNARHAPKQHSSKKPEPVKSNAKLPFTLKAASKVPQEEVIGRHPFADRMDFLFSADDDEYNAGQDEWNDLSNDPEAAMAYSKRVVQEQLEQHAREQSNSALSPATSTKETQNTAPKKAQVQSTQSRFRDPDVLFDAEDVSDHNDEDENDWGDFEGTGHGMASSGKQAAFNSQAGGRPMPAIDLLGLNDVSAPSQSQRTAAKSEHAAISRSTQRPSVPRPRAPDKVIEEEAWADFEDVPPPTPPKDEISAKRQVNSTPNRSTPILPPTNIPPPSVLLSTFPVLLVTPVSPQTLSRHLIDALVLAHIIAGRKYRWKRSPSLAASMRIGPAAAGGKSGMKLAGLDRSETAREEREVVDVLSSWRGQIGKLRTAVSAANTSATAGKQGLVGKVPNINETIPIKVLKSTEGGFTAPHECALCGLRREERIVKTDDDVEDSFGEWWVEGTDMHTFCKSWWQQNEATLRSK